MSITQSDLDALPTLSVIIPALNEEKNIREVVQGFLNNAYTNIIEVLVADGGSSDNTLKILEELRQKDSRVKILHNKDKFTSQALNLMLKQAQGDVILRADAHARYKPDYVIKCIETLQNTNALNIGGTQKFNAETPVQAAIAMANYSSIGSGGAKYKKQDYKGHADTVFLGCFKKDLIEKVGYFSEKNRTNEDYEFNVRVLKYRPNSLYVNTDIICLYFPRESFSKLFKQYFRYGRGRFITSVLHPNYLFIRGMVPFVVFFSVLLMFVLSLFFEFFVSVFLFAVVLLILFLFGFSVFTVNANYSFFKEEIWIGKSPAPSRILLSVYTFEAVLIMNIAHSLGVGFQLLRRFVAGNRGW